MNAIGDFLNNNGGTIGQVLGTGAQLYGQQNAGEAISKAATSGIGVAGAAMGDISNYWQPQRTLGVNSDTALSRALGIGGGAPDYSGFENMPGFKFSVDLANQAAQREAASMGNAGSATTALNIGKMDVGMAMQDYNNYIGQLFQGAQLGSTANSALTDASLRTAGNVEQLGMNAGMAQAGMYTGMGQTASGFGGNYMGGGYGGPNGSGVGGPGGVGGLIGSGLKALGGWLNSGGGNNGGSPTLDGSGWNGPGSTYSGFTDTGYASGMDPNNPYAQDPNYAGGMMSNGGDSLYVPGAGQGGNSDYISTDSNFP